MRKRSLETLLRVRRNRRDQLRLALARILADARQLDEVGRRIDAERDDAMAHLRSGTAAGGIDIDRVASLRFHAGRLSAELAGVSRLVAANGDRLAKARFLLTRADQSVKVVERLIERQSEVERLAAERVADREATDRFSSTRGIASDANS